MNVFFGLVGIVVIWSAMLIAAGFTMKIMWLIFSIGWGIL